MKKYKIADCFASMCFVIALIMTVTGCKRPKEKKITGTTAKVTEVIDGRTIKLSNNLQVRLLGVEKNAETKKFLERNVKGKKVKLVADSKDPKQTYRMGDKATVNAYVNVEGDRLLCSVNGRMIRTKVSKYVKKGVTDSLFMIEKDSEKLTDAELLALLKPRTFLIAHADGSFGTGFYISSNGIALTNAHVLNYSNLANTNIVPFSENGNFDMSNWRTIERILDVGSQVNTQTDYCIFEVSLNGETVPFLELAEKTELDGNKVWKLGCVKGEPAHFSGGNISHTIDGVITHSSRVNQGDSGSPLVNEYGQVIGINQSIKINENYGGDVGVVYAVDIKIIRDWFENHRDDQGQLRYGK